MWHHLTSVRMAITKSRQIINPGEGVLEKRELSYTAGGYVNLLTTIGNSMDSLKTRNKTSIQPSYPTSVHIP